MVAPQEQLSGGDGHRGELVHPDVFVKDGPVEQKSSEVPSEWITIVNGPRASTSFSGSPGNLSFLAQ
jgi:hypothetical protein